MAISEELRASIKAKLALGKTPREVADELPTSNYQTILIIKKKMAIETEKEKVDTLTSLSPIALDILVDKAKEEAPKAVVKKLEDLSEGINGLQLLDAQFHTVMGTIVKKAEAFLSREDLKVSDWVAITNALSNAYNNIFNNSGVSVNVNNSTQVNSSKLSMFKGSLRG